jgi:endonuclease/exonuclease/phosphatase family metal-dependent hydrolase
MLIINTLIISVKQLANKTTTAGNKLRVVFATSFLISCANSEPPHPVPPATNERIQLSVLEDTIHQGQFSIITYNIAGLPAFISSAQTNRHTSISEIGRRLNGFDIAHVQEDFNYHHSLCKGGNAHLFRSNTKGLIPFGDGLNTFSRYPIHNLTRISWNDCAGADCLTPKGFTYSRIEVAPGILIDFYNVHANAYNNPRSTSARRRNIEQLSDYITEHSRENAVIVMGDLNGHYSYLQDNIQLLNTINRMQDVWIVRLQNGNYPPPENHLPGNDILTIKEADETIDKILYRSSHKVQLTPLMYGFENQSFNNGDGEPLSDHHPVSARFGWLILPYLTKNTEYLK